MLSFVFLCLERFQVFGGSLRFRDCGVCSFLSYRVPFNLVDVNKVFMACKSGVCRI